MMPRIVTAEMLDSLAAHNPDAMRSRTDLQRIHRVMGTRGILQRGLTAMTTGHDKAIPFRVLELGGGDGSLMLAVAQGLVPRWHPVELTLLDRQALIDSTTLARYSEVGWAVYEKVGDVLDWAADSNRVQEDACAAPWDLILSNLFLHHFEGEQLALILNAISHTSRRFLACEPRRYWLALAGSHMMGALGVNHVTRQDAVLSVHAGFHGNELTAIWPHHGGLWRVQEYGAGLFSHCFRAERARLH